MTRHPKSDRQADEREAGPRGDDAVEMAEAVRSACLEAALEAYEDAAIRGLCREGAWEAAVGAIRAIDVAKVVGRTQSAGESSH